MAQTRSRRQELFVRAVLSKAKNADRARSFILEQVVIAEQQMDDIIDVRMSRDSLCSDLLAQRLLPRLNMPERIAVTKLIFADMGYDQRWPWIIPILSKLVELRNSLAHGYMNVNSTTGDAVVYSQRRGHEETRSWTREYIEWLAWQAHEVSQELSLAVLALRAGRVDPDEMVVWENQGDLAEEEDESAEDQV